MILALRALGVGDLATAVPALRGLRAAFPGEPLALAAPRWLAPLVDLVGCVDRLVPVDGVHCLPPAGPTVAPPKRWAGLGPRLAVNLHGRGPQSHRLLAAARPGRLIAFANAEAGHRDGPPWSDEEHEVLRWCRLLRWHGIAADPADLTLRRPAGRHPTGLTIVHPGAKSPARRWPADRFAAVARALAATGHRVVVTGSAAERDLAETVVELAGLPGAAALAGSTDPAGLAGLVSGARLLISGDTGIAHLATGYGTPSVVLFAAMTPRIWGPPPDRPQHRPLWHAELAAEPSGRGAHPALRAITVEEVLAAATEVDGVTRTGRPAGRPTSRDGQAEHAVAAQ